jgi:hypothetical protein
MYSEMGVFKEIWQRNLFLIVKLFGCLGWPFSIVFAALEVTEAVTDSDTILHAAITCIHNLLMRIHSHHCGSAAWNTKAKISQS